MTNTTFLNKVSSIQAGLIKEFKMSLEVDDKDIKIKMMPLHPKDDGCTELFITVPIEADSNSLEEAWNNFLHYSLYEEHNEVIFKF